MPLRDRSGYIPVFLFKAFFYWYAFRNAFITRAAYSDKYIYIMIIIQFEQNFCKLWLTAGMMSLSLLGLLTKNWFEMSLVIACYPLGFLFVYPFIPESFRWYFSKGKVESGILSLKSLYFRGSRKLEGTLVDAIEKETLLEQNETSEVYTMFDLFRFPNTKRMTLKMAYNWFALTMTKIRNHLFNRNFLLEKF